MVRAVVTGPLTVSGFDLAWFSSISSECLCVGLHGHGDIYNIYIYFNKFLLHSFTTLPIGEIGLTNLVD